MGTADGNIVDPFGELGSLLRSKRPPVELQQYRTTYRRTRIWANVGIACGAIALAGRFEHTLLTIGGILLLNSLVLIHARLRAASSLLEMVTYDTFMYIGMTILADAPEITLFVAATQTFIIFYFVPSRTGALLAILFL